MFKKALSCILRLKGVQGVKIFALADIHGELDRLDLVCERAKREKPDMILVAGDLTRFGPREDAETVINRLAATNAKVLAIPGNGDTEDVTGFLDEAGINLDKQSHRHGDVGLVGMGMPTSMVLGGMLLTQYATLDDAMDEVMDCDTTIFVSHMPPAGTKTDMIFTEEHVGSNFVKSFAEEKQPELLICGHIHESRAIDHIGNTLVVNPGAVADGYIAEIDLDGEDGIDVKLHRLDEKG